MKFEIHQRDTGSSARTGTITTDHGQVDTPIFMPVGTQGSVKGVHFRELEEDIAAQIILANTYHVYLRPGLDIIEKAGGIHGFNSWQKPVLTDSGGYQVYSLADSRKITEEGVKFKSHIDGSTHLFSPEYAIDIQRVIGADLVMAFDECTPWPCDYSYVKKSVDMTHRWLERCCKRMDSTEGLYGHEQTLLPIVQGGTYKDQRIKSAEFIARMDRPANAIGGLSVGEPAEELYAMTEVVTDILPQDKPRYLMGVGTPVNLLECIALGVDMFDCVMPTRNARNGMLFTSEGIINIRNAKWQDDFSAIDPNGTALIDTLHSKAYLRHLMIAKEMLGAQIASIHNLAFYLELMRQAREQISLGTFFEWKEIMVKKLAQRL